MDCLPGGSPVSSGPFSTRGFLQAEKDDSVQFIWYLQEFGAQEQIAASTRGLGVVCGLHGLDLLSLCRFGVICRVALLMRVVMYWKF